jgi:peptidoglycan-associated lipoprotein
MLKRLTLFTTIILTSLVFTVSCASKKKAADAAGGPDGGTMDSQVAAQDLSVDAAGSDGGQIAGLYSVHFDYDSSTLTAEARRLLSENADWIKTNSKATVQIEGHCDSRGSVEYNLALGERRAKAVKNYMTSLGIDSKRLTIISYGEEKPIAQGETEEAYAKNRRANFVPLGQ